MKIKKCKEVSKKEKGIILFTILSIFLIIGVFFYQSFAVFQVNQKQNLIEGNIDNMGDIEFAFYYDGKVQARIPQKEENYRLDVKKSNCEVNGKKENIKVSLTKDWIIQVSGVTTSKTKCNLYFTKTETFINTISNLPKQQMNSGQAGIYSISHENASITYSDEEQIQQNLKQTELRYAGPNYQDSTTSYVHNYIDIDNQIWRVIGLVNTIEGQRIKIVKNENIGAYSWDSSSTSVNNGYGINEWSQSDIMKLLNEGYDRNHLESETEEENYVNNSLYWNQKNGNCYSKANNTVTACDFSKSGLSFSLKDMIEEITWNTGRNDQTHLYEQLNINDYYEQERSNIKEKLCSLGGIWCNDELSRKINWKGKIGLIYPSDFGYASIGTTSGINQENCHQTNLSEEQWKECSKTDWLKQSTWYWTMFAINDKKGAEGVANISSIGKIERGDAGINGSIYPTVYLSLEVRVVDGDGTIENPFLLSL